MATQKTVGVIGGMGPAATAEFFRRLVVATPATRDEDHLHIWIDNDPRIPSRTDALLNEGPDPVPQLCAIARTLELLGAGLLAVPCNSAHAYLAAMREAVSIPILDMPGEAAARVDRGPAGLLATAATARIGLYAEACGERGIDVLAPDDDGQAKVTRAIAAVKAGRDPAGLRREILPVVETLKARGARSIVVGCTELSLIGRADPSIPWVDALDALVAATVREARGSEKA